MTPLHRLERVLCGARPCAAASVPAWTQYDAERAVALVRRGAQQLFGGSRVAVYGSFGTALWLPGLSDVDVVVVLRVGCADAAEAAETLAELRRWLVADGGAPTAKVVASGELPVLKSRLAGVPVDVSVGTASHSGLVSRRAVERLMRQLPSLRPLALLLKRLLRASSVNDPFSGGLGSLAVALLSAVSIVKCERDREGGTVRGCLRALAHPPTLMRAHPAPARAPTRARTHTHAHPACPCVCEGPAGESSDQPPLSIWAQVQYQLCIPPMPARSPARSPAHQSPPKPFCLRTALPPPAQLTHFLALFGSDGPAWGQRARGTRAARPRTRAHKIAWRTFEHVFKHA